MWPVAAGASLLAAVGGSAHRFACRVWGRGVCRRLPKPGLRGKPPDFRRTGAVYLKPYKQFTANGARFTGRDLSAERPTEAAEAATSHPSSHAGSQRGVCGPRGPPHWAALGGRWLRPRCTHSLGIPRCFALNCVPSKGAFKS